MTQAAERNVLITGGAGFVGSNLAAELLRHTSARVHIYDSLARPGVACNLAWLAQLAGTDRLRVTQGDVRDAARLREAARNATEIYHFAAQVAVTTSLEDPLGDCETNVLGTLNMLEAARKSGNQPFVLFTSTNKVYGSLPNLPLRRMESRYAFAEEGRNGIDESCPLDFHSPYGCSKGAADQYVHDYARIHGLPTVVFRMSCIAGPRQLGTEDQGWVAHFLYSMMRKKLITIYGDGRQVRDVLHVHDLVRAMQLAWREREKTAGQIYNVGGGAEQALSVVEAIDLIKQLTGRHAKCEFAEARPGDQLLYITNHARLTRDTGWRPELSMETILADIATFWQDTLRDADHAQPASAAVERVA